MTSLAGLMPCCSRISRVSMSVNPPKVLTAMFFCFNPSKLLISGATIKRWPRVFGGDIDHFALESPGNHRIENIGVARKLHLAVEQGHRADLASSHKDIEFQSFLREIAALLCDIRVHDPRPQSRRTEPNFFKMSACVGGDK